MAPSKKRKHPGPDPDLGQPTSPQPLPTPTATTSNPPPSKRQKQNPNTSSSATLFVRNLPSDTTTSSLLAHFSTALPVRHATAVVDPATGGCRGYGFVTLADAEDAKLAREQFDGTQFGGRKLRIEGAERRKRKGGEEEDEEEVVVEKKEAQAKKQLTKLIVRNLPWSFCEEPTKLEKVFTRFGKVRWVNVPTMKKKGKGGGTAAGFGFVVLKGRKNAERAIEGANGMELDGRKVAVDWAVEKGVWEGRKEKHGTEEELASDESEDVADILPAGEDDETEVVDGQSEDWADEEEGIDEEAEDEEEDTKDRPQQDFSMTLFVRNLPFTATDETLAEHFSQFGKLRYARVVLDPATERSRGTAFVCFFNLEDAQTCLRHAPRSTLQPPSKSSSAIPSHSVLQNEEQDPTGKYTLEGRVLQIAKAVERSEATRLATEGAQRRDATDRDKRRLYLLSEGTVTPSSPLYKLLSPTELSIRDSSYKQRKALIQNNPSLHLSLTRLSVRNIPRSVTSKDLKSLAREAVVGFASDVKVGKRAKLSREELARGGDDMETAEHARKKKGVGVVKQAKVVFESREGGKVAEGTDAGRSRGYGFIEYHSHRSALMGLRWLNGHEVGYRAAEAEKKGKKGEVQDKKKRLIVEFAIENAQVVHRRQDKEKKMREKAKVADAEADAASTTNGPRRRRALFTTVNGAASKDTPASNEKEAPSKEEKLAKRQRIIAKKRAQRRGRRKATGAS